MSKQFVTRLATGAISAYQRLVSRLETKWANHHPSSFRNYNMFKSGVHTTLLDVNDLLRLRTVMAVDDRPLIDVLPSLSRRELFVMRQVPRDLIRIAPVLLLAPLPGTFLILPVFFAYPRFFLSRPFWTEEQKFAFSVEQVCQRLGSPTKGVLHSLRKGYFKKRVRQNPILTKEEQDVMDIVTSQVLSGKSLSDDQLGDILPLFQTSLGVEKLKKVHAFQLCQLHDLLIRRSGWLSRHPNRGFRWLRALFEPEFIHRRHMRLLRFRSAILWAEDRLLERELEASSHGSLSRAELEELCALRGINPKDQTDDALFAALKCWIRLSLQDPSPHSSFRLHLPTLLYRSTKDDKTSR